jgi:hypothetical protein
VSIITRLPREITIGRLIIASAVGASLTCAVVLGVFAYHAVLATRADDPRMSEAVKTAFVKSSSDWIVHVDLPVRRVVLSSAEEFGSGNYLFVFDVYSWFGIGSGYATYGTAAGGGVLRDGGFAGIGEHASDSEFRVTRAAWSQAYGPGRLVAPAVVR